ncbi:hypothetical protein FN846DRAFT_724906 [Sphaerosporella brunnea]|uniref:Uncharacterized protein n=1 Tax=Sphaerosporella brunnea TaxID=1250544 RepID=A0A5J5EWE3_9PEZI|nr:hypothetical protein FN846DRAFT_724906 [Sphaerosporella brunnea]
MQATMREMLAIAVDFGRCGLCQYRPQLLMSTQIGVWPGMPKQSFKVPTKVAYPDDPNFPPLWGVSKPSDRVCSSKTFNTVECGHSRPSGSRKMNIGFLFTVPAPSSNLAIEAFKRIIPGTGFARHGFEVQLTEPQAAALYTLRNQPFLTTAPAGGFQVCVEEALTQERIY